MTGASAQLQRASSTGEVPAEANAQNTPQAAEASPTDLSTITPSEPFLQLVPRDFARAHLLISAGGADGREHLLVSPGTDPAAVFNVGVLLGAEVVTRIADGESIARAIDSAYAAAAQRGERREAEADEADAPRGDTDEGEIERLLELADRDLLSTQGKGPVVRLVDALLFEALGRGASDVHIQPLSDRTLVRYRVDGVLHAVRELPVRLAPAVTSRVKVMGRMDIAERRVPQDGRATVTIGAARGGSENGASDGRAVDLRISTLPTSYGERVVLRLLDNSRGQHLGGLESLGMPGPVRSVLLDHAGRSSGIVLVTGPTGSGKTTTLYATLRWIAARGGGELNVMTIEDPIEYELSTAGVAISQAQVNTRKGVTFATGLRHILRQDPDVVMVGEIRDAETARIAIQASLTGHLVFSTLHTNDAASAATRLIDLGVEPYLVSASLSAVLAQRLVRCVHVECGGEGCSACFGAGLRGRIGLFELMAVDEHLRELIGDGASASRLRAEARSRGMRSLEQEGGRLIEEGVTTELEVRRVVHSVE